MLAMRSAVSALLLLAAATAAEAQSEVDFTPEGLAQVKQREGVELERDSVQDVGAERAVFQVTIQWQRDAGARPADYLARRVRYLADCKAETTVIAAVAVFDTEGRMIKTLIAPPGAIDPSTPEKGTREAKWLKEVCRFM